MKQTLLIVVSILLLGTARAQEYTNVAVTVTNDTVLTWLWATQFEFAVLSPVGQGGVGGTSGGWYDQGSPVSLTASPAAHWHFVRWSGIPAGQETNQTAAFDLDAAYTNIQAFFALDRHALTVVSERGTPQPGSTNVDYGTVVTQQIERVIDGLPGTRYRVKGYRVEELP